MSKIFFSKVFILIIISFLIPIKKGYSHSISYIHQEIAIDSIANPTVKWKELKLPIYDGFNNGVYWFKIELPPSNKDRILSIPESHISRARLFIDNKEVNMLEPNRYVAFQLPDTDRKKVYYLRVNCLLEARIPIKIEDAKTYYDQELVQYAITGIYFGIVLAIILSNIISYYSYRNKTHILYVFMAIGMSANAFYKDGLLAYILGLNSINETLEPIINFIVPVAAIFFTVSYLGIEKELKRLKFIGISVVLATIPLIIIYLFTGSFIIFTTATLLNLLSPTIFLCAGFILWNKSLYGRLFTIAYGVPLFFAYDYYIWPHFGIKVLDLPLNLYKVGSIMEMLIFTYAVSYQGKTLAKENKKMKLQLIDFSDNLSKNKKDQESTLNQLTVKEIEVFNMLASSKLNKEIASELFISINTVKYHIKNIYQKLNIKSRNEVIRLDKRSLFQED